MARLLTILIPNYNRPDSLGRLLRSVFGAITAAGAQDRVCVAVVDDFSDDDPATVIAPFADRPNFMFAQQSVKCGNAELAFLTALEWVRTEYVWLLGNDDVIFEDSVATILSLLDRQPDLAFVLLNPSIERHADGRAYVPISATAETLRYEKTEDLFMEFGFCTSTTTFACLIMKTAPVREFHQSHKLTNYATVYAHTFTIFGALRTMPALFVARPLVSFTFNERHDEEQKLLQQSPNGVLFYYQTIGLARLIRECAKATGLEVASFGRAIEDEVRKDTLTVQSTSLSYFLASYFIEQLTREQNNLITPRKGFGHLRRSDVREVGEVLEKFEDKELSTLCAGAIDVLNCLAPSVEWRKEYFCHARDSLRQCLADAKQKAALDGAPPGPKKVVIPEAFSLLAGVDAESEDPILLTILLPVYNGEKYIGNLIAQFADAYARVPDVFRRIEIIVANNASTDRTQVISESFKDSLPVLKVLDLTLHVPTAEENIFRSFEHCQGTFTWALGVDDIPNFAIFDDLIALLNHGAADFYLFNFAHVTEKMRLAKHGIFNLNNEYQEINIVELTQRFGFWGVLAGISGQIMRTSFVKSYDFSSLIEKTGKIYAHVTAYLECFQTGRTRVVNLPLVFYKLTPYSESSAAHWEKYARLNNVFDEYFWTLGYIRHLQYLEARGVIGSEYLRYMLETNEVGFFRPVFVMADKLANQLRIMSNSKEARNQLGRAQMVEIVSYLSRKEPFLREYLWRLLVLHEALAEGRPVVDADWADLQAYMEPFNDFLLAPLFQCAVGDYEIYRVANGFFGVYHTYRPALLDRLRYLGHETLGPEVFAAASLKAVKQKIAEGQGVPTRPLAASAKVGGPRLMLLERELEVMRNSASWRITRPLRMFMSVIRQLRSRA